MATLIPSCCWSRAGDLNRRSSGILLSPVRNCLARSVSRASWRCVAAHSSRHVIFVVTPSSVFSRVAVVYVFWAQGSNTIRAQSTCQKLSLSVPIMGPLLVPRFGAKKMSPHSICLGAHFVSHRCQAGARGPVIPVRTEAINPGGTCSIVEREPATLLLPKDIMCDCISRAW